MSQAGLRTSNRPQSGTRLSAASAARRSPSPARGPPSEAGASVASSAKSAKSAARNKQRASTYPRKGTTLGDITLSPEEQQHLEDVLARFDQAKQAEDFRLKGIKDELIKKQKNRIRGAETGGGEGHCYNCGRVFFPLFNPAKECYICGHDFCGSCVEKIPNSKNFMCKFCHFESVRRGQLGIWFMEELKVARAEGRVRGVSGPEALRSSLLRLKRQSKADAVLQQGLANFRTKAGTLPPGGSTASEPSRTEQWVREATPVPIQKEPKYENGPAHSTASQDLPYAEVSPSGPDYQTPSEAGENSESLSPMRRHPSLSGSLRDSRRRKDRSRQGVEGGNEVVNQPHQAVQLRQNADSRLTQDGVPPGGSDYYSPSEASQQTEGGSPLRRRSSLTGSVADSRQRSRAGSDRGSEGASDVAGQEAVGIERPPSKPAARAASPLGSEGYAPAGGGLAAPIYRPGGMGGSLSDLRLPADRPRLSSEAGSVSSLSTASKEPAEGMQSDYAHASQTSSSTTRKVEDVPVPEPVQRKSRTLTGEEFSEMFGKPLDALAGPDHRRQMTGSLRSLRHVFPVRYHQDKRRHGSMLSIYSEKESSYTHGIPITGDLRLDIQYNKAEEVLRIKVIEARDLAVVDKKHKSCNPYVKSYLLPDKTKASKRKTSTKRHTRNPNYGQELSYGIPYGDLLTRSLQIAVWHKVAVGSNLFLGEVIIPFADFQFDTGPQWYPLSERRQLTVSPQAALQLYRGEILVAIKLVTGGLMDTQSELHVWVKSAKGLTTSGSGRSKSVTVDSFAKVDMMPEKDDKTKNKTSIIKKNNNPEWNSTFVYKNLDRSRLRNMGIQVTVWDHGRMTSNDFLGGCRLNTGARTQPWMDATGTEQSVWVAMLDRPHTWFEGLIRLRSIMD